MPWKSRRAEGTRCCSQGFHPLVEESVDCFMAIGSDLTLISSHLSFVLLSLEIIERNTDASGAAF